MSQKVILAAINKQVDDWNGSIQQMNPNFKDDTLIENKWSSTKWKCILIPVQTNNALSMIPKI